MRTTSRGMGLRLGLGLHKQQKKDGAAASGTTADNTTITADDTTHTSDEF